MATSKPMKPVERVVAYIRLKSRENFQVVTSQPLTHMGALLTDAVLQAGINYETVVKPRVERLKRDYPSAVTTSGFKALLRKLGLEALLDWKRGRKPRTLDDLVEMILEEGIETVKDLKTWLKRKGSEVKLRSITGIGPKTIDYLKILTGLQAIAIDSRLRGFLAEAGCPVSSYHNARKLLEGVADEMRISRASLDQSIWQYMAKKELKQGRPCHLPASADRPVRESTKRKSVKRCAR